ncbi:hypothetical protein VI08_11960 [Luteibacter yeojuensis]|uniref:Uncharacterized protein n=1 Tax=Luteibacter yeojuensis TaxID=345309 RepID=A0A0F3KMR2_9GAMM|nr:hypothetical protein VI08_11960 [Luteibacter yeojuensis]
MAPRALPGLGRQACAQFVDAKAGNRGDRHDVGIGERRARQRAAHLARRGVHAFRRHGVGLA